MQKAMQLLEQRDKKLIDVARLVGYESDAALSMAFKWLSRLGEYLKRKFEAMMILKWQGTFEAEDSDWRRALGAMEAGSSNSKVFHGRIVYCPQAMNLK